MSYHVLVAKVIIGTPDGRRPDLELRRIEGARGSSSWRNLTGTCTVELSKRWFTQEGRVGNLTGLIRQGDPIKVYVGWTRRYNLEFSGYVAQPVLDRWPCRLDCEDAMYVLKRTTIERAWTRVSLHTFLTYALPKGMKYSAPDNVDLGSLSIQRTNVARVLDELRRTHGLVAYFRPDGVLRVGRVYLDQAAKPMTTISLQRDVPQGGDGLAYEPNPRVYVRVKSKIKGADGRLHWVMRYAGDPTGDLRSFTRPGVQNATALQTIADQLLEVMSRSGFTGRLRVLGFPFLEHSQQVTLENDENTAESGDYVMDGTDWSFDRAGYWRFLTLGPGGPKLRLGL
jgi:hypothetical protein